MVEIPGGLVGEQINTCDTIVCGICAEVKG